jgi:predicted nucleic acid-binding protein
LIRTIGRGLVVPLPVIAEADHLIRRRLGAHAARRFLAAIAAGSSEVAYMSPGLLRRAVEIDQRYADLDLGLADVAVMAVAERHRLPILTFDFADFRATAPASGHWRLLLDEKQLARAIGLRG